MQFFHFIIAVYICVVIPVSGYFEQRRLKLATSEALKERAYFVLHGVYWIAALPIVLADPSVLWVRHSLELSWLWHILFAATLAYLIVVNAAPFILIRHNKEFKAEALRGYKKRQHTFPTTNRQ